MSESAGRVVAWQWERFISYGIGGGGHWEIEYGEEHPEILFQEDLKDPKKYRNLRALVPEQLLVEAENAATALAEAATEAGNQLLNLKAAVWALADELAELGAYPHHIADDYKAGQIYAFAQSARRLRAITETPTEAVKK